MNHHDGVQVPPAAANVSFARALIRRAAHRAPPDLVQRLEEEWLADLAARPGPLSRLRFALGCHWAARTIALEFGAPARIASTRIATATASGPAVVAGRPAAPSGPPRTIFFIAIVGLHVALAYALIHAFLPRVGVNVPTLVGGFLDPPVEPTTPPLPVPGPSLAQLPKVTLTPPIVTLNLPADPERVISVTQSSVPTAQTVARPVRRVAGGLGAGFPNAEDFYPENYRRLGKEGAVTVRVCVDAAGRLTAGPLVAQTSGDALFDASALELARAGSGRYRAATEDGAAVGSCYPFRVRFRMR